MVHIICFLQITEEKEKEKPAVSVEKTQDLTKKDDPIAKEKGMYEEDSSDEDKVFSVYTPRI